MKFTLASVLAVAAMIGTGSALTRPKANEYKDYTCQTWNYGHNSFSLVDVTMDDTTNSVYLTGGQDSNGRGHAWIAFSGKTGNGGSCTGSKLGNLPDGCVNINNPFGNGRVRCVRSVELN